MEMPVELHLAVIGAVVLGSISFLNAYVVAEASQESNPALVIASVVLGVFFFFMCAYNVVAKHRHSKMPVIAAS